MTLGLLRGIEVSVGVVGHALEVLEEEEEELVLDIAELDTSLLML